VSREVRTKRRVFFAVPCAAQVLYGSLTGNVLDPGGAAVAGAKVEPLDVGTIAEANLCRFIAFECLLS